MLLSKHWLKPEAPHWPEIMTVREILRKQAGEINALTEWGQIYTDE